MTDGSFITITTLIARLVIGPFISNQNPTGAFIRLVDGRARPPNFIMTESSTVPETITTLEMVNCPHILESLSPADNKEMCNRTHWYLYSQTTLPRLKRITMQNNESNHFGFVSLLRRCIHLSNRGHVRVGGNVFNVTPPLWEQTRSWLIDLCLCDCEVKVLMLNLWQFFPPSLI